MVSTVQMYGHIMEWVYVSPIITVSPNLKLIGAYCYCQRRRWTMAKWKPCYYVAKVMVEKWGAIMTREKSLLTLYVLSVSLFTSSWSRDMLAVISQSLQDGEKKLNQSQSLEVYIIPFKSKGGLFSCSRSSLQLRAEAQLCTRGQTNRHQPLRCLNGDCQTSPCVCRRGERQKR